MNLTLKIFFEYLMKRWWIILLCTFVGFTLAFVAATFLIQKEYSSTLKMIYEDSNQNDVKVKNIARCVLVLNENVFLDELSKYLSENNYVADDISPEKLLSKEYNKDELSNIINASYDKDTLSITIVVITNNYRDAQIIAEALEVDSIKQKLCDLSAIGINYYNNLTTISNPQINVYPISPNVVLYSITGILLGFILGVLLGLMFEKLDVRIKDEEDLLAKYNLPVLGIIPNFPEIEEAK